ncbi:MAG: helix-turn-helix domain-containing protein [Patescibacteria group bacterium]
MTQAQALAILKTGANVFLTGEPGSGKTHTVDEYAVFLRTRGIEPAICASTGIAATHLGGMTIHSWSGLGVKNKLSKSDLNRLADNHYIAKRVYRAKVLIIDEVSMLSANTFTMVEAVCRKIRNNPAPFGGLQVVLVGDFFQLPPVFKAEAGEASPLRLSEASGRGVQPASPELQRGEGEFRPPSQSAFLEEPPARFAYNSSAWELTNPMVCYLTEQYRQDDPDFLAVLSAIRRNVFNREHWRHIEKRKINAHDAPHGITKLFSHNIDVDRVNDETLNKLPGKPEKFLMQSQGQNAFVASLKRGCLSPETLCLKIGAAVMFTKNNPREGFVNGTLGAVREFDGLSGYPIVKARSGRVIKVEPMNWTIEDNGRMRARLTQLPLRLAWAITVHKSQGMSLDEAVMDLKNVFEFGQGYVALSRVRRLSGLHLLGWNERAFQVHPEIIIQDKIFRSASDEAEIMFSKISPAEWQKNQQDFIMACGGELKASDRKKSGSAKVKFETHKATLALWHEGKNAAQIAETRGLKERTIISHLETLIKKGKINYTDILRILKPPLIEALPKIQAVFRELDTDKLAPVFEKFNGLYSYDELRLVRMTFNKE